MNLTATVTFDPGQSTSKIIHIPIDRDQNDRAICSITFNHPARRALRGGHAEQCHGGGDRPGVRAGAVAGGRAGDGGHRPCAAVPGDAVPGGVRDGDGDGDGDGGLRHRGRHGDRYTATSGLRGARHAAAGGRHRRLRADRRRRRPAATHALGGGRRPAAGHRGRRDPLAAAGIDPGFTLALEGTRSETGVTASAGHSLTLRASLGWQVSLQRSNRNIQGNDSAAPARRAAEERVVTRAAAQYVVARSARCGMVRRHWAATRGCRGRRSAPRRPPSCAGRTWPRTWTSRIWMRGFRILRFVDRRRGRRYVRRAVLHHRGRARAAAAADSRRNASRSGTCVAARCNCLRRCTFTLRLSNASGAVIADRRDLQQRPRSDSPRGPAVRSFPGAPTRRR